MTFQPKKRTYDIEMQTLQTLSQKLSAKRADLADFACNLNADKVATIDVYLALLDQKEDADLIEELKLIRTEMVLTGEALWIMNADILTNLGLKLGKTGIRETRHGKRSNNDSGDIATA